MRKWVCILVCVMGAAVVRAGDDDVTDLTGGAKAAATAPAEVTGPPTTQGDALGTMKGKHPAGSREGTIVLSDGSKLEGWMWTTLETPLRVWLEEGKVYKDVEWGLVKRIDVKVIHEGMEDDWRWLKEGSDQKVYSGKKYPNVELAYAVMLANGEVIEGGVVVPVYVIKADGTKKMVALYKKYKGELGETMKDVMYIKSVELRGEAEAGGREGKMTTKLPLLPD